MAGNVTATALEIHITFDGDHAADMESLFYQRISIFRFGLIKSNGFFFTAERNIPSSSPSRVNKFDYQ